MRYVIVGGVTGGASTAARIRRLDESAQIDIYERGKHVSFSNCALPYYLSGVVARSDSLVLVSPEKFKAQYNIDVHVETEVLSVDRAEKKVSVKALTTGDISEVSYDYLVLSPGARPILPGSINGIERDNVFTVRNVTDIVSIKQYIEDHRCEDIAVVGGGFIGIELVENFIRWGKRVTLVESADQVMAPFDYDMAQILHKELIDNDVNLILQDGLTDICSSCIKLSSGKTIKCDAVIMAIGVAPETQLAKNCGLDIGKTGGILVDHNYQTSDPFIFAVGDAIEVYNRLEENPSRLALAGPAQRQARALADHLYGIHHNNKGVIGSSIVRVFGKNAACTGLNEKALKRLGRLNYDIAYVIPSDKVGLMPGSSPLFFKLIFEKPTGRILGAQAIGSGAVDKRIDVIATAITFGGTLEDIKELELAYAPLFGTAKDAVNHAALVGLNVLYGRVRQVPVTEVRRLVESNAFIVDVREVPEYQAGHLITAVNIPLSELRKRTDEIPKDRPVYLHCRSSQRSYNACRALIGLGFDNVFNISGSYLGICMYEYFNDQSTGRAPIVTKYNFN